MVNHGRVKGELARRYKPQWRLAKDMGVSPATLSAWLRGVTTPPSDLSQRIEKALGLPPGSLSEQMPQD